MDPVKPEFKRKFLKGIGIGLLAATATYFAANGGAKLYDKWITDQAGKSVAEWFETYYHIPK